MGKIAIGGIDSNQLMGSVGSHTFRFTNGQLVVSQKAATVTNPRTYEQVARRALFLNVAAAGKLLSSATFKFAFEEKEEKQTDYNMFFRYAMMTSNPVYITKNMRQSGICVPVEYPVSRGSLPKITYSYDASAQAFVTNLSASDVTSSTTVAEFSLDLRAKNKSHQFLFDDKLVYVVLDGTMGDDGYVHFEVSGASVLLSSDDTAKLSSVLPLLKIVNGKVAFTASAYSCIAVLHSRPTEDGVYVGPQDLVLSDDMKTYAATFRTADAKYLSMKSLGGWKDSLIGSKASTSLNNGTVVRDIEEGTVSGSEQGSGSSNGSSGSTPETPGTDPSTGDDPSTGGSSTGSSTGSEQDSGQDDTGGGNTPPSGDGGSDES